jgi:hypothetical protein
MIFDRPPIIHAGAQGDNNQIIDRLLFANVVIEIGGMFINIHGYIHG